MMTANRRGATPLLPNLLLPGVRKCGTSSLAWYLIQHPEICPGDRKEIHYFTPLTRGRPLASLDDYAGHFAGCADHTYRLDASTSYFYAGPEVVATIRSTLPEARVVVSLRDPVDRLFSSYRIKKGRGAIGSDMPFRDFLRVSRNVHAQGQDRIPPYSRYASAGVGWYVEPLRHWFDAFGDAVKVVFFEHLVADPTAVVADVCDHLGLDVASVHDFDYAVRNVTVDPRSQALGSLAGRVNRRVDRHLRRYPQVKQLLRRAYARVNGRRRETLSAEDRAATAEYYAPANRELREELAARGVTELPGWLMETARPSPPPSEVTPGAA